MTDLLGGTPTNFCLSFLAEEHIAVVTGVNIPMLLTLSSHREEKSLERIAALAKKAGRRSITLPQRFLRWRRRRIGSDILPKLQDGDHKRQKCRKAFEIRSPKRNIPEILTSAEKNPKYLQVGPPKHLQFQFNDFADNALKLGFSITPSDPEGNQNGSYFNTEWVSMGARAL